MSWKDAFPEEGRFFETKNGILYKGDCLEVLKGFPNDSIDLVLTDPPYNISQAGNKISRKKLSSKMYKRNMDIKLDFGKWDNFESERDFFDFTEKWFKESIRMLKKKGWIYVFFDKMKTGYFDLILSKKYEVKPRTIFAWLKTNPVPQFRKVNWLSASEFVWVGSKGKCKIKNFLKQTQMLNYMLTPNKSAYGKTSHPTEKPVILIKKFIETSSNINEVVFDPFMGSGTTAVACEKLGRKWVGVEMNEMYCNMIKKRLKEEVQTNKLIDFME